VGRAACAAALLALAAACGGDRPAGSTFGLEPCVVQGVDARCGTLRVPENRALSSGRTIGLRIVVLPARRQPARPDAFTYLAGGPGVGAASTMPSAALGIWDAVHDRHDILLVDQRGTGASHPLFCPPPPRGLQPRDLGHYVRACLAALDGDPTQYGTAAAADDLEAVRVALGYPALNVYGTSYGATLAQVYLARHPGSVRTVVLDGGTLVDIPFYARFARNGQRALDLVARRCAAEPACAKAFPRWPEQLRALMRRWNSRPLRLGPETRLTGDGLAGVVQGMTLATSSAAEIPLLVSGAAKGEYAPLRRRLSGAGPTRQLMFWSIWCNERWVGLDATGPWGTYLDGYTAAALREYGRVCALIPAYDEPASSRTRVRSDVPVLALVGEADPQDPAANLAGLRAAMPNSRVVVARGQGHAVGQYGCLPRLVARFVERGSAASLDTRCARELLPTPFALP
jgi:pimeloyl-ACP methyl ester carboxylesterase